MHRSRPAGERLDHGPPGWIRQSRECCTQSIHNHTVVDFPLNVNSYSRDPSFLFPDLRTQTPACGLRRHELAALSVGHLQQREGHWAIVDLRGKAGHVRTIPVPDWVHGLLDDWMKAAGVTSGSLFRRVSSVGKVWGESVTEKLVWHVVKEFAAKIGVTKLAPHDVRRSCAHLCRAAGGELEQIQFLLGHVSVQTTERYLGCTERISSAVNDRIGIEPKA
ncbi:MAG: site-specific integrase [Bryobacterales bacterium]|nr:site-specific integrase [Bryobacterales bacterium]